MGIKATVTTHSGAAQNGVRDNEETAAEIIETDKELIEEIQQFENKIKYKIEDNLEYNKNKHLHFNTVTGNRNGTFNNSWEKGLLSGDDMSYYGQAKIAGDEIRYEECYVDSGTSKQAEFLSSKEQQKSSRRSAEIKRDIRDADFCNSYSNDEFKKTITCDVTGISAGESETRFSPKGEGISEKGTRNCFKREHQSCARGHNTYKTSAFWNTGGISVRNLILHMRGMRKLLHLATLLWLLQYSVIYAEGHECGDNPMKQVLLVAKRTGRTLSHVLTLLREIDNPAYDNLSRQFRTYAACIGLVDTGYFKKRSPTLNIPFYRPLSMVHSNQNGIEDEVGGGDDHWVGKDDGEETGVEQYPLNSIPYQRLFRSQFALLAKQSDRRKQQKQQRQHHKSNAELAAIEIPENIFIQPQDVMSVKNHDENPEEELQPRKIFFQHKREKETLPYSYFRAQPPPFNKQQESSFSSSAALLNDEASTWNKNENDVERLKKLLYGPNRNNMNSNYLRWNFLWPIGNEEKHY